MQIPMHMTPGHILYTNPYFKNWLLLELANFFARTILASRHGNEALKGNESRFIVCKQSVKDF